MIEEEDFKGWLMHPVTQAVRVHLARKRAALRDQWEGGSFTHQDYIAAAMQNANAIGKCEAYAEIQELDYDALLTTSGEEESGK